MRQIAENGCRKWQLTGAIVLSDTPAALHAEACETRLESRNGARATFIRWRHTWPFTSSARAAAANTDRLQGLSTGSPSTRHQCQRVTSRVIEQGRREATVRMTCT